MAAFAIMGAEPSLSAASMLRHTAVILSIFVHKMIRTQHLPGSDFLFICGIRSSGWTKQASTARPVVQRPHHLSTAW